MSVLTWLIPGLVAGSIGSGIVDSTAQGGLVAGIGAVLVLAPVVHHPVAGRRAP